ncbi:respiratory nitrate reductase subunit gamma [Amycolatopsis sp. cmx-11-12]|uniref:respiratory nitrate reductase subunit gamma n=1 Tax=Amycolatopsis sp. cmx-11-12 TaxID=2785795 RepID=UPI003917C5C6
MTSTLDILLWAVLPYVTVAILVLGTIWRYRYDRFGWTTRSSQVYESRLLRVGSPMFHFGLLVVVIGHFVGLVIPKSLTTDLGLSNEGYHVMALSLGGVAGICTLTGIGILIWRRRTTGPVFLATTKNDKTMYVVLVCALVAGLATTVISVVSPHQTDYRETVSPWFRSLFILQPEAGLMAQASLSFKVHAVVGMALFAIWPFTRLVHAFSAPIQYLFRPYIVYRSRESSAAGTRPVRRGWEQR